MRQSCQVRRNKKQLKGCGLLKEADTIGIISNKQHLNSIIYNFDRAGLCLELLLAMLAHAELRRSIAACAEA